MRPPDTNGARPPQPRSNESDATADDQESLGVRVPTAAQLRRRRAASWRLVPLAGGVRDPIDWYATPPGPSDYGLSQTDLLTEIDRCRDAGWADWELRARFTDPKQAAA